MPIGGEAKDLRLTADRPVVQEVDGRDGPTLRRISQGDPIAQAMVSFGKNRPLYGVHLAIGRGGLFLVGRKGRTVAAVISVTDGVIFATKGGVKVAAKDAH